MRKKKILTWTLGCLVSCMACGADGLSNSCVVYAQPTTSLHWKTALSSSLPISIDWPDGATKATLTISSDGEVLDEIILSDRSQMLVQYQVPIPLEPDEERVLLLTLAFTDDDVMIEERVARIGSVQGVDGYAVPVIANGESSSRWAMHRTHTGTAVVPIPEGGTTLSVTGVGTFDLEDAPGWFELTHLQGGACELQMSVNEAIWLAVPFFKVPGGLMLFIK